MVSREFEAAPVRMTYEELSSLATNSKRLVEKANGVTKLPQFETSSFSLSGGEDTITISDWERCLTKRTFRKPLILYGCAIEIPAHQSPNSM